MENIKSDIAFGMPTPDLPMQALRVHRKKPFFIDFKEIYHFRYVVSSYVEMNLKLRYRKSFLGFVWTVLSPLMSYLVIGFVFSMASKATVPNFFLYFFSGSVFFNLISVSITKSPSVMIENENYIKKIYVPKLIFVLNAVSIEFVNFVLSSSALLMLGAVTGYLKLTWSWLFLPIPIFFTLLALIGIACFLSVVSVFFRDLIHVVPLFMQITLFLTPIMYAKSMLGHYQKYLWFNPLYYFVECFRTPILTDHLAPWYFTAFVLAFSLICFGAGVAFLRKFENRIVFKL